jgi:hypothetical protein
MTGISEDTRLRMEDPVAHVGMAFGLSRFPLHCRLVGGDQRPDVLLERVVAGALPLQERVAWRAASPGAVQQAIDPLPLVGVHRWLPLNSRWSRALAVLKSRLTVTEEIWSTSAVSSD